jgi:two-component system cell cycle sensor histidine kinase/response regulator CckA
MSTTVIETTPETSQVSEPPHEAPETQQARVPRSPQSQIGGLRVLLVEDEERVCRLIRLMLEALSCEVVTAPDGVAAEQAFRTDGPFDLLLSDVVLPQMTGVELAQRLQETHPKLHVLLMSGYLVGTKGPEFDGSSYPILEKPFTKKDLAESLTLLEYTGWDAGAEWLTAPAHRTLAP